MALGKDGWWWLCVRMEVALGKDGWWWLCVRMEVALGKDGWWWLCVRMEVALGNWWSIGENPPANIAEDSLTESVTSKLIFVCVLFLTATAFCAVLVWSYFLI